MNDQRQGRSRDQEGEGSKERRGPSATEWLVGGISTLLVLTGIGFLAHEAWKGTSLPPMLVVEARGILPQPGGGHVVEIVAANRGGTTARGLVVEGRLLERGGGGGEVVERSTATLAWVPAHAEREGGLFFARDPRRYRLEVTPRGYDRP